MKKLLIPMAVLLSCMSPMSQATTFDMNKLVLNYDALDSSASRTSTSVTLVGGADATANITGVLSFDYIFSTTETSNVNEDVAGFFVGAVETTLSTSFLVGPLGTTGPQTYTFATPTSGPFYFFVMDEVALKNPSMLQISNIQIAAVSPVPEPETYALFGTGIGVLAMLFKRRRRPALTGRTVMA